MLSTPLVSIVLATYNRSAILAHAIESVRGSTLDHWELIVVGDCCTDDTAAVVAGTFVTGTLGAGQSVPLIAKVTVKSSAAVGASMSRLVTISGGPPSAPLVDAVKFTAKRK